MSSFIGNFNTISYDAFSSANSNAYNKLYVPVNKASLLYSHFEHVSGVPAKQNQQGVSISKLRILNSLIDKVSSGDKELLSKEEPVKDSQIDKMINIYQQKFESALKNPFTLNGSRPIPGELFSFQV